MIHYFHVKRKINVIVPLAKVRAMVPVQKQHGVIPIVVSVAVNVIVKVNVTMLDQQQHCKKNAVVKSQTIILH